MTSTADSFGHGQQRAHPLILLVGHYNGAITAWLSLILSVRLTAGSWFPHAVDPIAWPFLGAFLAVGLTTIVATKVHNRQLCFREERDIALVLDPQAAVEKYDRRLRAAHRFSGTRRTRRTILTVGVAFVAAMYGIQQVWPLAVDIINTILVGTVAPLLFYLDFARMTHRRLQPWCKYCRRRGKGHDDTTPTPRPDPVGQNAP